MNRSNQPPSTGSWYETTLVRRERLASLISRLLQVHYGIDLVDVCLESDAAIERELERRLPAFEIVNELAEEFDLDRIDVSGWGDRSPKLTVDHEAAALQALTASSG
jgi:hypothetical protein